MVQCGAAVGGYTSSDGLQYHRSMSQKAQIQAPFTCAGPDVPEDWIDYNGHMNVGYYLIAFDQGTDRFFDFVGVGTDYMKRTNRSTFTLETPP